MHVNPKKLVLIAASALLLSGCTFIESVTTPKEWGTEAGRYASGEWIDKNGGNSYPTADSIALYCVNISEDGQKKYDWTVREAYESTMACTEAFARGLGLKG